MALRGLGTRRTASGDPEEPIKVDVMDTRSVRSGGHNPKGPLECTVYILYGGVLKTKDPTDEPAELDVLF